MKYLLRAVAVLGLALVLAPSIFYYADDTQVERLKLYMLVGTALWFAFGVLGFRGASASPTDSPLGSPGRTSAGHSS